MTIEPKSRRSALSCAVLALLVYAGIATFVLSRTLIDGEVLTPAAHFLRNGPFDYARIKAAPLGNDATCDAMMQFEPWRRYAANALAVDGRIPAWKDTASCGAPLIGNGQSAFYFPTVRAALLLGNAPWTNAALAFLKLVTGAFAAYLLARRFIPSFLPCLLAGVAFGFAGFELIWLVWPHTYVSSLLPLVLLGSDLFAERPTLLRGTALALVCGLQHLGGHAESAFHSQVVGALLGLVRIASAHRSEGIAGIALRGLQLGLVYVLGAALGAVQLLPQVEYILQSDTLRLRPKMKELFDPDSYGIHAPLPAAAFLACCAVGALALRRLSRARGALSPAAIALAAATFAGISFGLDAGLRPYFVTLLHQDWFGLPQTYRGEFNHLEANGAFIGSALALALAGLLFGRPRAIVKVAAVVAASSILTGMRAPLINDLVARLPVFSLAPTARMLLIGLVALALLAAFGLAALAAPRELPARAASRFLLAACAVFGTVVLAVPFCVYSGRIPAARAPIAKANDGALEAGLFARDVSGPPSDPRFRVFGGWVRSELPPAELRLQFANDQDVAALVTRVPDEIIATRSELAGLEPPLYVFRAEIFAHSLHDPGAPVLLKAVLPNRRTLVSAPVQHPDLGPLERLPFPVAPAAEGGYAPLWLLLAMVLAIALALSRPALALPLGGVALLLACGQIVAFGRHYHGTVPPEDYFPSSPAITALQTLAPDGRMLLFGSWMFPAEVPSVFGIQDVRGYDALIPRRVAKLLRLATDQPGGWNEIIVLPHREDVDLRLLGVMAVRWLVNVPAALAGLPRVHYAGEETIRPFPIAENPDFLARARLVAGAEVLPDEEAELARIVDPSFDPRTTVLLAEGEARPAASAGTCAIETARPDRVVVRVEPTVAGHLVLADSFFPGWTATVDGAPREILRANHAFRAVAVRPGDRRVEFRYAPASVRIGGWLSFASYLALLFALWRAFVNRRGPSPGPSPALAAPASTLRGS